MSRRDDLEADWRFRADPIRCPPGIGPCQWCERTPAIQVETFQSHIVVCETCFVRWNEHTPLTGTIAADVTVTLLHLRDVMKALIAELSKSRQRDVSDDRI